MDKLDRAIADKRKELAQLRQLVANYERQAELAGVALRALESAAQMRPSAAPPGDGALRRGRQPGAISAGWRKVLERIYLFDGLPSYEAIADVARQCGIAAEISSVRERVRRFQELGFLEGAPDEGFRVTEGAVQRFNLSSETQLEGFDAQDDGKFKLTPIPEEAV